MSKFRIQRLFAIALGIITLAASWFVTVQQPSVLLGCFMVFWGFDGWVNE
jgi:hypothetical protein